MMNRWGWHLFWSLAAVNVFAWAGYQWSHAYAPAPPPETLVDAFERRIPLTADERASLIDLESRILQKRRELMPELASIAPAVREVLLAQEYDAGRLSQLFQKNLPSRVEYLQYEHHALFEVLQKLSVEKRAPLVDFLVEHRLGALRRWVDQSGP